MRKLSNIVRISIPAAMVTFIALDLTVKIATQYSVENVYVYVIIIVSAILTGIGTELWGIQAGDNLEKSWRLRTNQIWTSVQVVAYATFLTYLLWDGVVWFLPIVAMLAYVTAALSESLLERSTRVAMHEQRTITLESEQDALEADFDREQRALDLELERKARIAQIRLEHEERLARIAADATVAQAKEETKQARMQKTQARRKQKVVLDVEAGVHECEACGRSDFRTHQALNAHRRWCDKIKQNGSVEHEA